MEIKYEYIPKYLCIFLEVTKCCHIIICFCKIVEVCLCWIYNIDILLKFIRCQRECSGTVDSVRLNESSSYKYNNNK